MTYNILEQLKLAGFDELEFNEVRLMIELSVRLLFSVLHRPLKLK